jgi:hypothetical protein
MLRILSDLNYKYSFALNLQHVKALPPSPQSQQTCYMKRRQLWQILNELQVQYEMVRV